MSTKYVHLLGVIEVVRGSADQRGNVESVIGRGMDCNSANY